MNFPDLENVCIQIERTEAFIQTANELSAFLKALPLSHDENNKLVELMVKHVKKRKKEHFYKALAWVMNLTSIKGWR